MFDTTNANCATTEHPEIFFPEGGSSSLDNSTRYALSLCSTCPVKLACLQEALSNDYDGIWGGTTAADRRALRLNAKRPLVITKKK